MVDVLGPSSLWGHAVWLVMWHLTSRLHHVFIVVKSHNWIDSSRASCWLPSRFSGQLTTGGAVCMQALAPSGGPDSWHSGRCFQDILVTAIHNMCAPLHRFCTQHCI